MRVLLVHGLARTPLSMALLARRLRREGHAPETFGYVAAVESWERIVARLTARLAAAAGPAPYAVIGHSLGGILLREAIARLPAGAPLPVRLVLLASPGRVPRLAPRANRWLLFRLLTGEAGRRLADPGFFATLPEPPVPHAVLAGDAGPRVPWLPFAGAPNDGIVAVEETAVRPGGAVETFPLWHTWLMNDARLQARVVELLRSA